MKVVFVPQLNNLEVRFAGETLGILSDRHFEAARAAAIEVNQRVKGACPRNSGSILYDQIARQAMRPYLLPN